MKKKELNKLLAVAAFGLVTANTSIEAKAEEASFIAEEAVTAEAEEPSHSEENDTPSVNADADITPNTEIDNSESDTAVSSDINTAEDNGSDKTNSPDNSDAVSNETDDTETSGTPDSDSTGSGENGNPETSIEAEEPSRSEENDIPPVNADTNTTPNTEITDSESNTAVPSDTNTAEDNGSDKTNSLDNSDVVSNETDDTETSGIPDSDGTGSGENDDPENITPDNDAVIPSNTENGDNTNSTTPSEEDTDSSLVNKKPSNFEEAKENLEEAKKEEAAAGDKLNNAQTEADNAQEALDNAKQEAEKAGSKLEQAKEEKDKAQFEKDKADQAVSDSDRAKQEAQENFDSKLTETGTDRDAFEDVQKELEEKKEDVEQAEQDVHQAQNEYDAKEQEASDVADNVDEAKKAVDEAQSEKDKADGQVADAETAVTNAQTALEEAKNQTPEDAVNNAKAEMEAAEKSLKQAKEQLYKGSLGFFEEMVAAEADVEGSTAGKAVKLLTSTEDMSQPGKNHACTWEEFRSYTNIGDKNDATSLENMKRVFDLLRECNCLRTSDELRQCDNELLVSDYLMALAQMNANWARESGGKYNTHAGLFYSGENLAWGPSGHDPYKGWYYDEKVNYKNGNHEYGADTGHYINITNNLHTVTGLGVCTPDETSKNGWLAYAQPFAPFWGTHTEDSDVKTYTVDEYEKRFDDYCSNLNKRLQDAKAAYDKAKVAYEAALKNASSVSQLIKDNIANKQKEFDNAQEMLNNAKKQADEKNTILENAKSEKTDADSKLEAANKALAESLEKLNAAKSDLEQAQAVYNDALSNAERQFGSGVMNAYAEYTAACDEYKAAITAQGQAATELEEAQTVFTNAESKKKMLDSDVKAKETVLAEKNTALNTAKQNYLLAVANLAIAQDDYNRLKPAAPSHSSDSTEIDNTVTVININSTVSDADSAVYDNYIIISISADDLTKTATFSPKCSFRFFINELERMFKENNANSMTFDCSLTGYHSINIKLLNALKERSDGEFTVIFTYMGKKYTFTIPANYDFSQLKDSKGWYGFMYLKMMFGGHEII